MKVLCTCQMACMTLKLQAASQIRSSTCRIFVRWLQFRSQSASLPQHQFPPETSVGDETAVMNDLVISKMEADVCSVADQDVGVTAAARFQQAPALHSLSIPRHSSDGALKNHHLLPSPILRTASQRLPVTSLTCVAVVIHWPTEAYRSHGELAQALMPIRAASASIPLQLSLCLTGVDMPQE